MPLEEVISNRALKDHMQSLFYFLYVPIDPLPPRPRVPHDPLGTTGGALPPIRERSLMAQNSGATAAEYEFEQDSDDICFNWADAKNDVPRVKAATEEKLIERLTHRKYPGTTSLWQEICVNCF